RVLPRPRNDPPPPRRPTPLGEDPQPRGRRAARTLPALRRLLRPAGTPGPGGDVRQPVHGLAVRAQPPLTGPGEGKGSRHPSVPLVGSGHDRVRAEPSCLTRNGRGPKEGEGPPPVDVRRRLRYRRRMVRLLDLLLRRHDPDGRILRR